MDSIAIVAIALGFYTTTIAVVAIVFGKEDIAKMAVRVHEQIAKTLSQLIKKQ